MVLWSWSVLQRYSGIANSPDHNKRCSDRDGYRVRATKLEFNLNRPNESKHGNHL